MAEFTMTLETMIYHYSQLETPEASAEERVEGKIGSYPFLKANDFKTIEERIEIARPYMLPDSLPFSKMKNQIGQDFRTEFWTNFCVKNLRREITGGEAHYWMTRMKWVIRSLLPRYNLIWETYARSYNPFLEYEKHGDSSDKYDETHGDKASSSTDSSTENRSVFNDTPSSSLGDKDYATSITDDNGNTSSTTSGETNGDKNSTDVKKWNESGRNKAEIELAEIYITRLKDTVNDFVNEVSKQLFFGIIELGVY